MHFPSCAARPRPSSFWVWLHRIATSNLSLSLVSSMMDAVVSQVEEIQSVSMMGIGKVRTVAIFWDGVGLREQIHLVDGTVTFV